MNSKRIAAVVIVLTAAAACASAQQWQSHFDRPYVFASSQLKYGLYQDYLHRYMDRPLLMDTSLGDNAVVTCPSFHRIMDHAMMYGSSTGRRFNRAGRGKRRPKRD